MRAIVTFIIAGLGALIALLNFYLSFIRYSLHHLSRKGQPYKFVSGIPFVGSILLWVAAAAFSSDGYGRCAAAALTISLFDTGGVHWLIVGLSIHRVLELLRRGDA